MKRRGGATAIAPAGHECVGGMLAQSTRKRHRAGDVEVGNGDHDFGDAGDINSILTLEILTKVLVDRLNTRFDRFYVERVCRVWESVLARV
jgi:hypothetical protein